MNILVNKIKCGINGFESPAKEYQQSPLCLDDILVEDAGATLVGQIIGNELNTVGIFDGDLLIISRTEIARNKDIIVVLLEGETLCMLFDEANYCLTTANQAHLETFDLSNYDDYLIIGVVTRSIRMHKPLKRIIQNIPLSDQVHSTKLQLRP